MSDVTTPAVGNEMFLHNMRALWKQDPHLALRVDAVDDQDRFAVEPTRSGSWTVKVPTPSGLSTYLHSRYDPVAEARKLADSVPIEDRFCFVVLGMGLGHHLKALFERLKGDAFIICVEPSIPLVATALCTTDLTDMITSRRLFILTDADKARIHERLKDHNTLMMLGAQFVQHPPSMQVMGESTGPICQMITEFVAFTRMSLATLVGNSKITCRNIAMNLVHYVTTPPIDILRDRFAGNPAVVISAGPSLRNNIAKLTDLKGKAVLCAVQTTLKPLMQRGIVPDFVTSLDFHEMSQKFFEDVGNLSDVHLVAEPKATWGVLDNYPGPVSVLESNWARLLIGDELAARGGLKAGATVAHLAFYLAVHMGCDPIIFVGQDLAFTGHVFYVPGVEIHHAWRSEINRFNTMEMKEWDRIARNRPILRKTTGIDGQELYTDELLFTYLEQFEKDIAEVPATVINATEGGAHIRGTTPMTLREAAERFCEAPIDRERFAYRKTTRWRDDARLEAARKEMAARIKELDGVTTLCEEMRLLLKELKGMTGDPARFNKRLIRVDELRVKVQHESRAYRIVNQACQLAEFRRYSADRKLGLVDTDDVERAKRQIARDLEFVTGVRDGAEEVKPMLTDALKRLESHEDLSCT